MMGELESDWLRGVGVTVLVTGGGGGINQAWPLCWPLVSSRGGCSCLVNSSSHKQPCTRFGVCSGPQSVLDPSNIRPVLVTLGIACVLGALLYFTNNIAVSEAMERRRLMYSKTGSFVPPVCLPDAPKDVRHSAVDGRPPSVSAITNGSSSERGRGPARY